MRDLATFEVHDSIGITRSLSTCFHSRLWACSVVRLISAQWLSDLKARASITATALRRRSGFSEALEFSAHLVAGVELIGGILLVLGLASRLTGLVLTVNMLVAYIAADREAFLSIISDPDKFTGATPYTFLFASLVVLIFGAGWLSGDGLLATRNRSLHHAASVHPVVAV